MGKKTRTLYILVAAILVLVIPQLVMSREDGNLLVRVTMMTILALLFYAVYSLLKKLKK